MAWRTEPHLCWVHPPQISECTQTGLCGQRKLMPRSAGVALISADTWPLSPLQGVSFLVAGRSPPSRSTFPWTLPEPLRILGSFLVVDSQITPSCSKSRTCAYRVLCTPLAAAAHRSARSSRLQTASTRSAIAWVRPRCIPGVGPSSECERSSLQLTRPSGRVCADQHPCSYSVLFQLFHLRLVGCDLSFVPRDFLLVGLD